MATHLVSDVFCHSLLSSALMLYDKYLFSLSIFLEAEIMHFTVLSPQMLGMHHHLCSLSSWLFFSFFNGTAICTSLPLFRWAFFGTNDTVKSWCWSCVIQTGATQKKPVLWVVLSLEKGFTPLELFHTLSPQELQSIVLGFHVTDQHKAQ